MTPKQLAKLHFKSPTYGYGNPYSFFSENKEWLEYNVEFNNILSEYVGRTFKKWADGLRRTHKRGVIK